MTDNNDNITQLRRILGPTLQMVGGKLDVNATALGEIAIGEATRLVTNDEPVVVGDSDAPDTGDILIATSATEAEWGPIPVGSTSGTVTAGNDSRWRAKGLHVVEFITSGTPGVLDNSNFQGALVAAITYAESLPTAATVILPGSEYTCAANVIKLNAQAGKAVSIRGQSRYGSVINFGAVTSLGKCIEITAPNADTFYIGNLEDFRIKTTIGSSAYGIYARQLLFANMRRIAIDGMSAANSYAVYCTDAGGMSNNQNSGMFDCVFGNCYNGVMYRNCTQFVVSNTQFNNCINNQIVLGGGINRIAFTNIMLQGGGANAGSPQPALIATAQNNPGGNHISLKNVSYQEGYRLNLFRQRGYGGDGDYLSTDIIDIEDINLNGITDAAIDVQECILRVVNVTGTPESGGVFIRASGALRLTFDDCSGLPDPLYNPEPTTGLNALYDLDETSMKILRVTSPGISFEGSQSRALSITELLRPYAAEIWDPSVATSVTITSGEVSAIKGLVNGTSATPFGAGTRPAIQRIDPNFGGQTSLQFTSAGLEGLQGTLAAPLVAGDYGGVFAVMRKTGASTGGVRRGPIMFDGTYGSQTNAFWVSIDDFETGGDLTAGGAQVTPNTNFQTGPAAGSVAHAILSQATLYTPAVEVGDTTLYTDQDADYETYGSNTANPLTATVNHFLIPACDAATVSSNLDLAYLCFLKRRLPQGVIKQLYDLSNQRFGIVAQATPGAGITVTTPGDVVGPASSTSGDLASFSGTTGKLLQDSAVPSTRVGKLRSATTDVDFSAATAPSLGMVPQALSTTTGTFVYPGRGQVLTADSANLSTGALANVAGFSWTLTAGVTYAFRFDLYVDKLTSNGTFSASANYSAGITSLVQFLGGSNFGTAPRNTSNNTAIVSGSIVVANDAIVTLLGQITPSANGTLVLAAATSTADAVIKAGSSAVVNAAALV